MRRRLAWLAAVAPVAVVLAAWWPGCSVEKNYELLRLFFDGVPDPHAAIPLSGAGAEAMRRSPTYSVHAPYAREECASCHQRRFELSREDSRLCLDCHSQVPGAHERMHGPVAAGACLWCHAPHESPYRALLKAPSQEVCGACHDRGMLGRSVSAHADPEADCLECHMGHGGARRYFLRGEAAGRAGARTPPPGRRGS